MPKLLYERIRDAHQICSDQIRVAEKLNEELKLATVNSVGSVDIKNEGGATLHLPVGQAMQLQHDLNALFGTS